MKTLRMLITMACLALALCAASAEDALPAPAEIVPAGDEAVAAPVEEAVPEADAAELPAPDDLESPLPALAADESDTPADDDPLTIEGTIVKACRKDYAGEVVVPEGITEIASYAFRDCVDVTGVTLPESLVTLNQHSFSNCGLTSVRIPGGVVFGPNDFRIFSDCVNLERVELAEGLTSMGSNMFTGCTALKEVVVPESLEGIGGFGGCASLEHIDLSHAKRIGSFWNCDALTDVVFPEGLQSIGYMAFEGCDGLTRLEFPASLTRVGDWAFRDCTGLKEIVVHCSLPADGVFHSDPFDGCDIDTAWIDASVIEKNSSRHFGYHGDIIVTGALETVPVRAFFDTMARSVTLPDGVKTIDEQAFREFWGENVYLPDGVEAIGREAFLKSKITAISLPDSVVSLGEGAFSGSNELTCVRLGSNLEVIPRDAFYKCVKLEHIDLSEGLREIGIHAFYHSGLTSIFLPDSVTALGSACFETSYHLSELRLSPNLDYIPQYAFSRCDLQALEIPGSVRKIDFGAFSGNPNLAEITLNEGLEEVVEYAFGNSAISVLYIPRSIEYFDGWALYDCKNLKTVYCLGTPAFAGQATKKAWHTFKIVNSAAPNSFSLSSPAGKRLTMGDSVKLGIKFSPAKSYSAMKWSSSNKKIATVDKYGNVTTFAGGKVTITAKARRNGRTAKITLTVIDPTMPTAVTLDQEGTVKLNLGDTLTLTPTLAPDTAVSEFAWKSSDKKIATVADGVVTPVRTGKATITVKTKRGGKAASVKVKVVDPTLPTGVALDLTGTVRLNLGDTLTLTPTVVPETAVTDLVWKSSDKKIAKVADGIVIPVRTGTATITVKTRRGGKVASVKVKVVDPKVPTKVTFTQTGPLPCAVGESIHLSAVITPDTAMDAPLKWTTSNKAVAKVDQTGRVTGVKKGKAQITVASANGKKATITINVTAQ